MAAVQCKVEIPSLEGLKEQELTVGREFYLSCEGEWPKDLQQDKLQFILKPEQKYSIKLLHFEFRSPSVADLKVTAYHAGGIRLENLQLSDGQQTLDLGTVEYLVQTVLEQPAEGGKPQEPFGPIGPAKLPVPALYWALMVGVLLVVIGVVSAKLFRVVQRRNMIRRLKRHDSAQSPIAEFYATQRRIQRSNPVFFGGEAELADVQSCVIDLQKALLIYLTRRYQVPALEWSPRLIIKNLKSYHRPVYEEFHGDLLKLLKEFYKALQAKQLLRTQDALNLSKRTRKLVEEMEKIS